MFVDYANGTSDVSLEFGNGGVNHIPEVDLIGQPGEGSKERLDRGIGTDRSKVLKFN